MSSRQNHDGDRFPSIADIRRDVSLHETAAWLGVDLKPDGQEWKGLCPLHEDKRPSFTIYRDPSDQTEKFKCFGCGEHGDVIDLVSQIKGVSTREALSILSGQTPAGTNAAMAKAPVLDPYAGIEMLSPTTEIASGDRVSIFNPKRGTYAVMAPTMVFPYRRQDGSLIGYVVRRDFGDGEKETPMIARVRLPDGKECWARYPFPKPRPLYGLDRLLDHRQVIVVEGEKSADALWNFRGKPVVTWPGGTNGAKHADWSPLAGRDVLVWPDADAPGYAAAREIGGLLAGVAERVRYVDVMKFARLRGSAASDGEPFPFDLWAAGMRPTKGFDVADCAVEGWSSDAVTLLMRRSVSDELEEFPGPGSTPPDPKSQHSEDIAPHMPENSEPQSIGNRPIIVFEEAELPSIVDNACRFLVDADAEIYARGTSLVRPIRLSEAGGGRGVGREKGTAILVPVGRSALIEKLTESVRFLKMMRSGELRPIACPTMLADTILARMGDWPFHQLLSLTSAPTMRKDLSLLETPGFDRASGIYFASDLEWPAIPKAPAREAALAGLGQLKELLAGFPFVGQADLSGALALILTALIRPALPTAPMTGVSAPTPGTGKSKIIDIAAVLATGHAAAVMSAAREETELKKQLDASLMAGDVFLALDNIEHPLRSEALCQMLTQGTIKARILGKSENADLPTALTLTATGNSLRFAGDLTRRVVLVNLDAGVERPEERIFTSDAVEVARKDRVKYVVAGLTVLRAYIASGAPPVRPALGSFERWSDIVRSALIWLGETDPLANATRVRENDPERERTMSIFRALPTGKWKVADIAQMLREDQERTTANRQHVALAEVLAEFCDRGVFSTRRFGTFLGHAQSRIVGGMSVQNHGKDRMSNNVWEVRGREDLGQPPSERAEEW